MYRQAVADALFDSEEAMVRIDQTQFDCIICCYDAAATHGTPDAGRETLALVSQMRARTTHLAPVLVFGYDYQERERRKRLLENCSA